MNERNGKSTRPARIAAAIVIAAAAVMSFAALGGVGFAKSGAAAQYPPQYQYGKVTICHHAGPHGKTVTITVSQSALPAHMRHGDTVGPCR